VITKSGIKYLKLLQSQELWEQGFIMRQRGKKGSNGAIVGQIDI